MHTVFVPLTERAFSKNTMMQRNQHNKRAKGDIGENYSSLRLEKDGYSVICRNYVFRGGEIDIIASKGQYLCFVEVKTRSILSGENAAEAVDSAKLERLKKGVCEFLREFSDDPHISALTPRIDIMEIYTDNGTVKKYNHIIGIS